MNATPNQKITLDAIKAVAEATWPELPKSEKSLRRIEDKLDSIIGHYWGVTGAIEQHAKMAQQFAEDGYNIAAALDFLNWPVMSDNICFLGVSKFIPEIIHDVYDQLQNDERVKHFHRTVRRIAVKGSREDRENITNQIMTNPHGTGLAHCAATLKLWAYEQLYDLIQEKLDGIKPKNAVCWDSLSNEELLHKFAEAIEAYEPEPS